MKIGDLVKFANGNPKAKALGIVLPPVEGMSLHWAATEDDEMVNVFWTHTGIMPYHKDYIEVIK